MTPATIDSPISELPPAPEGRDVVLHARVVTQTGGGPDKTILQSCRFFGQTDYWIACAYMHPPEDRGFDAVRRRAVEAGAPLISVPDRGPLDRGVFRRMLDVCRRYRVKVWHGHDYKSNLLGLAIRPFHPMKLVTTVHGWVKHTARTPLYYAVDRWSLPFYHHVICVSDDLEERVRAIGLPPERVTLLQNAIDEKLFSRRYAPSQSALRQDWETPAGRLVIGAVGRLSPEKAFNHLIRATATLIGEGHDLELWIAGDGEAREELAAMIQSLGVGDRVKLLGFVSDTLGLYHAMDLFVLSSLREGLPNVVLEALAMGVPVVSTAVAGVPKMITDGKEGLLTPIGDVAALTAAMRTAVSDAGLRSRLAAEGRALIERGYSFARRMDREREIYDRLLGKQPPPGEREA